jgi:hypothetical protein
LKNNAQKVPVSPDKKGERLILPIGMGVTPRVNRFPLDRLP